MIYINFPLAAVISHYTTSWPCDISGVTVPLLVRSAAKHPLFLVPIRTCPAREKEKSEKQAEEN